MQCPLYEFVFLTIAAQVTTLPLLLYHFQRVSWLSLPANLLILPVQPALMMLGGLSVLLGLLWQPLGSLLALFAWPLAGFTIRVVELFAGLPWAARNVEFFSLGFVLLYYFGLLVVTIPAIRARLVLPQPRPAAGLALLAALSLWVWSAAFAAPSGRLEITLLDVGGEAILVQTPAGRSLLINGGPSAASLSAELGQHLSPFHRQLDWLLVAGIRGDQIDGLSTNLDRLSPAGLAWAISGNLRGQVIQLYENAVDLGFEVSELQSGQTFDLGNDAQLEVLSLGERGAVLLLQSGDFRALLPLGLDFEQLENLDHGSAIGRVDLLLLADGGYPPLNPTEWLLNLRSGIVWLAGDEEPDAEMLNALQSASLLRTAEHGWLKLSTDGSSIWLESAR